MFACASAALAGGVAAGADAGKAAAAAAASVANLIWRAHSANTGERHVAPRAAT
jgi:hypothetical protein